MWYSYLDSAAYGDWYWLHVIMVGKKKFFLNELMLQMN